jgi:hypothetical protein
MTTPKIEHIMVILVADAKKNMVNSRLDAGLPQKSHFEPKSKASRFFLLLCIELTVFFFFHPTCVKSGFIAGFFRRRNLNILFFNTQTPTSEGINN